MKLLVNLEKSSFIWTLKLWGIRAEIVDLFYSGAKRFYDLTASLFVLFLLLLHLLWAQIHCNSLYEY